MVILEGGSEHNNECDMRGGD